MKGFPFMFKVRKHFCEKLFKIVEQMYKDFVSYTLSRGLLFLFLIFLKWEGVRPVVFLNWVERC